MRITVAKQQTAVSLMTFHNAILFNRLISIGTSIHLIHFSPSKRTLTLPSQSKHRFLRMQKVENRADRLIQLEHLPFKLYGLKNILFHSVTVSTEPSHLECLLGRFLQTMAIIWQLMLATVSQLQTVQQGFLQLTT